MNPLLQQLHDIEGLDPVSAWPLAIGWWAVIGGLLILSSACAGYLAYRLAFKRSWKNDTLLKLSALERGLCDSTAREIVVSFSEYLRRIALRRYPRKECAGLTGKEWLKWLKKNDPKGFDWELKGTILVDAPYTPFPIRCTPQEIKELIQAARNWVR